MSTAIPYTPIQDHLDLQFELLEPNADQKPGDLALDKIADELKTCLLPKIVEQGQSPSAVLVFLNNRRLCEQYARDLSEKLKADAKFFNPHYYHAGMSASQRQETYDQFQSGNIVVLFATKAFGMGMDIPNIHHMYHLSPPSSLEDYLQEVGRAGRNEADRVRAGHERITCRLYYQEDSFSSALTRSRRNAIQWPEMEWLRRLIEQIQDSQAGDKSLVTIPADLLAEDIEEELRRGIETRQQLLLFWLEKLKRIRVGDFVGAGISVALGPKGQEMLRGASREVRAFVEQLYSSATSSDEIHSDGRISVSLIDLARHLGVSTTKEAFRILFGAHEEGAVIIHRNVRIEMSEWALRERALESTTQPILSGRPHRRSAQQVHSELCSFMREIIAAEIAKGNGSFTNARAKDLLREEAAQLYNSGRTEDTDSPDAKLHKEQVYHFEHAWPALVRLVRAFREVSVKTTLQNGETTQIFDFSTLAWSLQLNAVSDMCNRMLPTLIEAHRQKKTIELVALMKSAETNDVEFVETCLIWLSMVGYLQFEQRLIPLHIQIHLLPGFDRPVLLPVVEEDRSAYDDFINFGQLKDWRLWSLQALTEVVPEQRISFVQRYFACANLEAIKQLVFEILPQDSPLHRQLTESAYGEEWALLNEQQRAMVSACSGNSLCVTAGPGAGKTRTLMMCVATLLKDGHARPDQIIVLAYNRAVVSELKARCNALMQTLGFGRNYVRNIYTFHGYAAKHLSQIGEVVQRDDKMLVDLIARMRERSLSRPDDFRYVFIDEFQDITQDRFEILELLAPPSGRARVIAIGDDDQSIYGYQRSVGQRSARPWFEKLTIRYGAQRMELLVNYRSLSGILDYTENYINSNSGRMRVERLKPDEERNISEYQPSVIDAEAGDEKWASTVCDLISQDVSDIAVLFRGNEEALRGYGLVASKVGVNTDVSLRLIGNRSRPRDVREVAEVLDTLRTYASTGRNAPLIDHIEVALDKCFTPTRRWSPFIKEGLRLAANRFTQETLTDDPVTEFIAYIGKMRDFSEISSLWKLQQSADGSVVKQVVFSTFHKVKGLEFDAVVMPPSDFQHGIDTMDALLEERRIQYVGMTRAKKHLYIFEGQRERLLNAQTLVPSGAVGANALAFDTMPQFDSQSREWTNCITLISFLTKIDQYHLVVNRIMEGDNIYLQLENVRNPNFIRQQRRYRIFVFVAGHKTAIGLLKPDASESIIQKLQNRGIAFDQLKGLYVTEVKRYYPADSAVPSDTFGYLKEHLKVYDYWYIVNFAGYLTPA